MEYFSRGEEGTEYEETNYENVIETNQVQTHQDYRDQLGHIYGQFTVDSDDSNNKTFKPEDDENEDLLALIDSL